MTMTADRVGAGAAAARTSGRGRRGRAAAEPLSRADRVAQGKDARRRRRWSRMRSSPRPGRGSSGCCWNRRRRGCRSWCRSGRADTGVAVHVLAGSGAAVAADLATTPPRAAGAVGRGRAPVQFRRVCLAGAAGWSSAPTTSTGLPGPFEWDVKRLPRAWSWRDNGFTAKACCKIVLAAAEGYRTAMRAFADQPLLDVWYAHVDIEQAIGEFRSQMKAKRLKEAEALLAKAHTADSTKSCRRQARDAMMPKSTTEKASPHAAESVPEPGPGRSRPGRADTPVEGLQPPARAYAEWRFLPPPCVMYQSKPGVPRSFPTLAAAATPSASTMTPARVRLSTAIRAAAASMTNLITCCRRFGSRA